jgi:ubiquinone/menaquinone biosynthesis C-methylase UbiE
MPGETAKMKMNLLEKLAMNNPVRAMIQRRFEAPLLERLGGRLVDLDVLEVGCGQGIGTQLLLDRFAARKVVAVDLDEGMLRRASRRLSRYSPERWELRVGDVTNLDLEDHSFDAVVNFAAIHHVPVWQAALKEIHRVLKPGGRFFFEEVTARWIHRWPYRTLFAHPRENRFSSREFIDELERVGIMVGDHWVEKAGGDFVFGVGRRRDGTEIHSPKTGGPR